MYTIDEFLKVWVTIIIISSHFMECPVAIPLVLGLKQSLAARVLET